MIMFDDTMYKLANQYRADVRPKLLPNARVGNENIFFLTLSGKRITNIATRTGTIGKHLGFQVFTPGQVRRSWSTYAALNLPVEDREQVGQQMSHSKEVDAKYYANTQSLKQAAGAYSIVHQKKPRAEENINVVKKAFTEDETNKKRT